MQHACAAQTKGYTNIYSEHHNSLDSDTFCVILVLYSSTLNGSKENNVHNASFNLRVCSSILYEPFRNDITFCTKDIGQCRYSPFLIFGHISFACNGCLTFAEHLHHQTLGILPGGMLWIMGIVTS